jgi:hypothetical protein
LFTVGNICIGQRDEQAAVIFNALFGDLAQNAILLNAFPSCFNILDAVTSAAVQQAMGTS